MNEQNTNIRPTKKQQELLEFIEEFINQHDYSPSYREIMAGCNYTSVATVALHVNNLIERGHLVKREHSARSLEVVKLPELASKGQDNSDKEHEKWLDLKIKACFKNFSKTEDSEKLLTLVDSLSILQLQELAEKYRGELDASKISTENS